MEQQKSSENQQPQQPQVKIVDIPIKDQNSALNVIIYFISVAQKRGAFTLEESSKIWECMQHFQPKKDEKEE